MRATNYKCIVVGASGSGKSTIIQRLVDGTFREEARSTIGVEFKSYECDVNGKHTKLQIWDTAGQERFRSVAKSYFRNAIGAMLVFDLTSRPSFDELSEWLNDIHTLSSPNSVIILIGNKSDLTNDRTIGHEEAKSFSDRHGLIYFETSARNGLNISQAFNTMATEITQRIESRVITLPTITSQPPMMYTNTQSPTKPQENNSGCC